MTRYAMVADLRRCVGCQTCTAACKQTNGTASGTNWRDVLDVEIGTYPDVARVFMPVGCQHCANPPCESVCPTTATWIREDGIVDVDYDKCIGCGYCAVACPYQARYIDRVEKFAYGKQLPSERERPKRTAVATKCNFCRWRVDAGVEKGLVPGIDPEATPVCVNSCIAEALHFGDIEDKESNVSKLIEQHEHFRMHEELNTQPAFFYITDKKDNHE